MSATPMSIYFRVNYYNKNLKNIRGIENHIATVLKGNTYPVPVDLVLVVDENGGSTRLHFSFNGTKEDESAIIYFVNDYFKTDPDLKGFRSEVTLLILK